MKTTPHYWKYTSTISANSSELIYESRRYRTYRRHCTTWFGRRAAWRSTVLHRKHNLSRTRQVTVKKQQSRPVLLLDSITEEQCRYHHSCRLASARYLWTVPATTWSLCRPPPTECAAAFSAEFMIDHAWENENALFRRPPA